MHPGFGWFLLTLALAWDTPATFGASYQNPLIPGDLADPTVIRHQGVFYLYATGDVDGDNGIRAFTSTNLLDWTRGPVVFQPGQPHVWAPDVWRDPDSGRFYLYYTVSETVGVADADGPLGPFTQRRKFHDKAIDAHLFRDDGRSGWLCYSGNFAPDWNGESLRSPWAHCANSNSSSLPMNPSSPQRHRGTEWAGIFPPTSVSQCLRGKNPPAVLGPHPRIQIRR